MLDQRLSHPRVHRLSHQNASYQFLFIGLVRQLLAQSVDRGRDLCLAESHVVREAPGQEDRDFDALCLGAERGAIKIERITDTFGQEVVGAAIHQRHLRAEAPDRVGGDAVGEH